MSSFKDYLLTLSAVSAVAAYSEYSPMTNEASSDGLLEKVSAFHPAGFQPESSVRCPNNDGSQAYDVQTNRCCNTGSSEPCGHYAAFVPMETNSVFGHCVCHNMSDCHLPLTYLPDHDRSCFYIFTQGPCGENEWLVPVRDLTSTCVPNTCPPASTVSSESTSFTFNGQFFYTETPAYCPPGKIARFLDGGIYPACDDASSQRCKSFNIMNPAELGSDSPGANSCRDC